MKVLCKASLCPKYPQICARPRGLAFFCCILVLMSEMKFTAIYEPAAEGGYVAYAAELPGANTQGETLEEARENLKDAVKLLVECGAEPSC